MTQLLIWQLVIVSTTDEKVGDIGAEYISSKLETNIITRLGLGTLNNIYNSTVWLISELLIWGRPTGIN